ncbi:ROK family protein [bacterium]|nr:ROK family protein [bacterium]
MAVYAIDLGGTRIKMGIVNNGKVVARDVIDAKSCEGLSSRLIDIENILKKLAVQSEIPSEKFLGVGLAFPSLVDNKTGCVLCDSDKYSDAESLNLNFWCRKAFALPFAIENDARMAMIGEWRFGAGRDYKNIVMITLGTGIGTSALIEGNVLRGVHSRAGCLGGHLTINYTTKRKCYCGNLGCAEAESGTHFLSEIIKKYPELESSELVDNLNYKNIFSCAENGDLLAIKLKDNALKAWSALAVNLIHAYDPEMLIIGGGIMKSADVILPYFKKYIKEHAGFSLGCPEIKASELGDSAALLACEWLVQEKIKR